MIESCLKANKCNNQPEKIAHDAQQHLCGEQTPPSLLLQCE